MKRAQHSPIITTAFVASVALHALGALAFVTARQPSFTARAAKEALIPVDFEAPSVADTDAVVPADARAEDLRNHVAAVHAPQPIAAARGGPAAHAQGTATVPSTTPTEDPSSTTPTDAPVTAPARVVFASTFTLSTRGNASAVAENRRGTAQSTGTNDDVMPESGVSVPARLLESAVAAYPIAAREAEIEADVPVQVVLDVNGRVVDARALATTGYGLDDAAVRAVRAYRFSPAQKDGHAVRVRMRWMVQFRLR